MSATDDTVLESFPKSTDRLSNNEYHKNKELEQANDPIESCPAFVREIKICNKRGLHARASARFVKLAQSFKAVIEVEKDGLRVGGTSIMGLMMLAAAPGCAITVQARGEEATQALDALEALVNQRFGEDC